MFFNSDRIAITLAQRLNDLFERNGIFDRGIFYDRLRHRPRNCFIGSSFEAGIDRRAIQRLRDEKTGNLLIWPALRSSLKPKWTPRTLLAPTGMMMLLRDLNPKFSQISKAEVLVPFKKKACHYG